MKIEQYRNKFLDEINTDENLDYRRGFYAGCLFAALEANQMKYFTANAPEGYITKDGISYGILGGTLGGNDE